MEQNQQMTGARSNVRRSEEEIQKHLCKQEQSGLTVKEYCEMYDIVEQTFYSWLKRYRGKTEEEVKCFGNIEVLSTLVQSRPLLFAEIGSACRIFKNPFIMNKLLAIHDAVNYYLYRKPVKMSRSFDGLAALIRTELGRDIVNGDVFIFLNRNRSMIKVYVYEQKGFRHMPINRQVQKFAQSGIIISDNTMGDWINGTCRSLTASTMN